MTLIADIVIRNGTILTMDDASPTAEAIAILGNRIIRVGTNADCMALTGSTTEVLDADGATVLPGFNEAHLHIFAGGVSLQQLDLGDVKGPDMLREQVGAYLASHPDTAFLAARSANYDILSPDRYPTREDLDRACPDTPFVMLSTDIHTAWTNTAALQLAGIENGRDVGPGGRVVTGADGKATGELREAPAISLVSRYAPWGGRETIGAINTEDLAHITEADRKLDRETILGGLHYCASHGITSVQSMDGNLYQLQLVGDLKDNGRLPVRVRIPFLMQPEFPADAISEAAAWRATYHDPFLRCDFVKIFADGVVESGTAFLINDYSDAPGERGMPLYSDAAMNKAVETADSLGFQVAVHAIGDAAVRQVLDAYEAAKSANGRSGARHRIEHIELLHHDDFPRFVKLGVVASMQPPHPPGVQDFPLDTYMPRIGPEREDNCYRTRELQDIGVPLVFSTDWPVARLSPMASIKSAVTRKPWRPGGKDQSVTLDDALKAYTRTGAWVEFEENRKGVLRAGYLADITVLSADLHKLDPECLDEVHAVLTMVDGRVTYRC